jgi:hypothetical protein
MVILTKAQRAALFRIFQRDFPSWITPRRRHERACCPNCGYGGAAVAVPSNQYRRFRQTVMPGPGCVMVPWKGMWLGIEPDGYVHS